MKTTEVLEPRTKSNDLRHTITTTKNGKDLIIKIRLNDECKNGHQDFAITADVYAGGKRGDRNLISAGCCHDEILEARPDLKLFVDLHLATFDGVPMYAIENGFYFLKNGNNGKSPKDVTMDYLRITESEFEALKQSEDEIYFQAVIEKLGIPERWKAEANAAIKQLEEWTGKEFVNDSKKTGFTPLGDKLKEIEQKIESGYYSPERIAERETQNKLDAKNKLIQKLTEERDKEIQEANNEFNIKMEVLRCGLPLDNFIYYNHTNEGCFNWNTSSYNPAVTQEQFEKFLKDVDTSKLPQGITFKLYKR